MCEEEEEWVFAGSHVRGYISTNYMNHSCACVRDRGGGRLLVSLIQIWRQWEEPENRSILTHT